MRGEGGARVPAGTYDGLDAAALAARTGAPAVRIFARLPSTMDAAHAWAAEGAPRGAVVVADAQSAGRGRAGRAWDSAPGAGVWATVVLRPHDRDALGVLSLRVGLRLAGALDPLAGGPVRLKWPNDLLVGGRKLAGVLVEVRWRDERPEWAAVGVGVNVRAPAERADAAGLAPGTARLDALAAVVRGVQEAAQAWGRLSVEELAAIEPRDALRGRRVLAPVAGTVAGVAPDGSLLVRREGGTLETVRDASVRVAD